MGLFRRKRVPPPRPPRPPQHKKGKCKIKVKKTDKGEQFEFSPECTSAQIEFAKQHRQQPED